MLKPELVGRECLHDLCCDRVLESVAGSQRRNRDVFFLVVRINRGIACNRRSHFFHGVGTCGHIGAVGFVHDNGTYVHFFVRVAITKHEFAERLKASVALNADADVEISFSGAVIFKSSGRVVLLDDERFLSVVGWRLRSRSGRRSILVRGGGWRSWRCSLGCCKCSRGYEKKKKTEAEEAIHPSSLLKSAVQV